MGKALISSAAPSGRNLTTGQFAVLGNGFLGGLIATEADYQTVCRVAGTFSKLAVSINATGTSRVYRFRVNGANGNQVITPTDSTAGVFADNSNADTLASGDKWDISTSSTSTPSATWFRAVFEATANHACYYSNSHSSFTTASTTAYCGIGGDGGALQTTEASVQSKLRVGGTLRYLQVYVTSSGRSSSSTYKTRINGADGASAITITPGATGLFEDTSGSDTVAAGDLVDYALTNGTGSGAFSPRFIGCWIINTTDAKNDLFSSSNAGVARSASGTANYYPISGTIVTSTTEANAAIQHGFDGQATRLRLYLSANTYSADATATFRVAAADGNQTVTLTAGATGWFEDTTHSDSFTSAQACAVKIVGGTSGSITLQTIGLTETSQVVVSSSGSIAGTGALTGTGTAVTPSYGIIAGVGALAGTGRSIFSSSGTIAGVGTLTGTGLGLGTVPSYGTISGTGTLTGVWTSTAASNGSIAGSGSLTGTGTAVTPSYGTIAGTGALNGVWTSTAATYGTIAGTGALIGAGAAVYASYGTIAGVGTLTGTGKALTIQLGKITRVGARSNIFTVGARPAIKVPRRLY